MHVNTRGHARRSDSEWRSIVRKFNAGSLTIKDFCSKEKLVLSTFKRWQQKITAKPTAKFVDLAPEPIPAASSSWELDIDLPNGVRLLFRG